MLWAGVFLGLLCFSVSAQDGADFQALDGAIKIMETDVLRASRLLSDISSRRPSWDYPYILLGELYEKSHLVSQSQASYLKALEHLSQKSLKNELTARLAVLSLKLGNVTEAQGYLADLPREDRFQEIRQLAAQMAQAEALAARGDRRGVNALKNLILKRSDLFSAYRTLGQLYEKLGLPNDAVKTYEEALLFPPVKNLVLSGINTAEAGGIYRFIRDSKDTGLWTLSLQLPYGNYDYRFIRNYGFPDEQTFPDPAQGEPLRGEKGLLYNRLSVSQALGTVRFQYRSLPLDPLFSFLESRIASLRRSALERIYPTALFNNKETGESVTFTYYDPRAYAVWAVGSFNRFGLNVSESDALDPQYYWPLRGPDRNGLWTLTVNLPPGEYFYYFVVNEDIVVRDPILRGRLDYNRTLLRQNFTQPVVAPAPVETPPAASLGPETLKGYKVEGNELVFTYNPQEYKTSPQSVLVSGAFNGWTTGKAEASVLRRWTLTKQSSGLWTLRVPLRTISDGTEFKFIIDSGVWQNVPPGVPAAFLSADKQNLRVNLGASGVVAAVPTSPSQPAHTIKTFSPWSQLSRFLIGEVKEVTVNYNNTSARTIRIAGDFNEWGKYYRILIPDYNLQPLGNGDWTLTLRLPKGAYEFRYVVDGFNWVTDPALKSRRSDNSEIVVR